MAFTGTAVVTLVSDAICRITGLSLAHGASGTIGLFENISTPGVSLPGGFKPRAYKNAEHQDVSIPDAVEVRVGLRGNTATSVPIQIVKTGLTPAAFLATLTNNSGGTDSTELEIYVKFHQ